MSSFRNTIDTLKVRGGDAEKKLHNGQSITLSVPFNFTFLDVFIYELKLHGCMAKRFETRERERGEERQRGKSVCKHFKNLNNIFI